MTQRRLLWVTCGVFVLCCILHCGQVSAEMEPLEITMPLSKIVSGYQISSLQHELVCHFNLQREFVCRAVRTDENGNEVSYDL